MTKKLYGGFQAALNGFKETILFERNFRIMIVVAIVVVAAMFYFPTSRLEKVGLLFAIASVLILELINSTIERIMDVIEPEYDERVRIIKDLMAAIVLLASLGAVVVGAIIFFPYIYNLFA
ncbi:MAG: diacylglycerol kinase [Patescibacteria group bacterium]|nr:diacylglycerol kinase [Patescibacteria group bacterium]MCL5224232.1 diacylglycerol kinase [Patescibacteria group bacterium]